MGGVLSIFTGWFLLVLFNVSILFYWLLKAEQRLQNWRNLLWTGVVAVDLFLVFIMDRFGITTTLHFEIIPAALLFYTCGYLMKGFLLSEKEPKPVKEWWIFAIPICTAISYWNTPVLMYLNDYGNLCLFVIGAFLGILVVCEASKSLQENMTLQWFGKYSIYIYVLQFKLLAVLKLVGRRIFRGIEAEAYPIYFLYFLVAVIILVPVVYVCDKYIGILFGKPRRNKTMK